MIKILITNCNNSFKLIGNELYIKDKDDNVLICSFRKDNKDKIQFTKYYGGVGFPFDTVPYAIAVYFKRLNSIPQTLTQSIEFPNAVNWNNPKLLLDYWISHFKCSYNNFCSKSTPISITALK